MAVITFVSYLFWITFEKKFRMSTKLHYRGNSLAICFFLAILCFSAVSITSCSTSKRVKYFKNIPDSLQAPAIIPHEAFVEPTIQPNDKLAISIQTVEQKNVAASGNGSSSNQANDVSTGYTVDKNGYIEVPLVGRIKVDGLTLTQAKDMLRERASKYFVDPIVNVIFLNLYINVIGDVAKPGRIAMPNEKITLIDALSLASDLTISGKRENVLLIREENGQKVFVRFNLNNTNLFQSPYYYMKSGDVVYVEPNKAKARASTTDFTRDRYISYVTAFISVVSIIFAISNSQK